MTPRLTTFRILFVSLLLAWPTCAEAGDTEKTEHLLQAGADIGNEDIQQELVGLSDQVATKFFVTVFVTSLRYSGNLVKEANKLDPAPEPPFNDTQGLEAGDFICNTHAKYGGHWGQFAAWLSTDEVDAKDRLTSGSGPFLAIDGAVIADSVPDLTDGNVNTPITIDEIGLPIIHGSAKVDQDYVWTGTKSDGTAQEGGHCSGWAHYEDTDAPSSATVGTVCDDCEAEWTLHGSRSCNWRTRSHLYCFRVRSNPDPGSPS